METPEVNTNKRNRPRPLALPPANFHRQFEHTNLRLSSSRNNNNNNNNNNNSPRGMLATIRSATISLVLLRKQPPLPLI